MCGAFQRCLLSKEFQATQGRRAHLALFRVRPDQRSLAETQASGLISLVAFTHPVTAAEGVCPSLPPLTVPSGYSYAFRQDEPFRPKRGWGWPTLRSPGTNSWQQLCSQQTAVGRSLLFSRQTSAPISNSSSQSNQVSTTGVYWL